MLPGMTSATTATAPQTAPAPVDRPFGSDLAVEAHGLVKTFGDQRAVDGDRPVRPPRRGLRRTRPERRRQDHHAQDARHPAARSTRAQASIFGVDVRREPHVVRQLLGVTGQYASVDETLTATENLVLFARLQGVAAARPAYGGRLLEQFDLTEAASKPIKQFSGGMRRRLDLAASLITRPPLIFLDEPTTGLDPRTRGQMWDTIRELVARRLHRAADHSVPRRGRPARRPHRGHRPRP